jgi:hypothetical protein
MSPYKTPTATTVPKTLEKRLEIMNAIRTLATPDGDDEGRKRRG